MRCFRKMLFMGAEDHSAAKIVELIEQFHRGLSILSGLQQGAHDIPKDQRKEAEQELKDIIADIRCAFGHKV